MTINMGLTKLESDLGQCNLVRTIGPQLLLSPPPFTSLPAPLPRQLPPLFFLTPHPSSSTTTSPLLLRSSLIPHPRVT